MNFRLLASLAAAALLFLIPSCATRPGFDFQTGSGLVLGATTPAQARGLLGKPNSEQLVKNSVGQFTYFTYWYAKPVISGEIAFDTLTLTFKNDSLQQYCFQNPTGKELWRRLNLDQLLEKLKKGTSTRTETVDVLGQPSGKTLCRFKDDSKKDSDAWYWKQKLEGAHHYRTVIITFDAKSIISDIQQSESQSSN